jgi:hypothetical protein
VIELDVAELEGVPRPEGGADGLGGTDQPELTSPHDRQDAEQRATARGAGDIPAEHEQQCSQGILAGAFADPHGQRIAHGASTRREETLIGSMPSDRTRSAPVAPRT